MVWFLLLWYVIGYISFIWHWNYNLDVTLFTFLLGLLIGIMGPIAIPVGYIMHPRTNSEDMERIFIKRRN